MLAIELANYEALQFDAWRQVSLSAFSLPVAPYGFKVSQFLFAVVSEMYFIPSMDFFGGSR